MKSSDIISSSNGSISNVIISTQTNSNSHDRQSVTESARVSTLNCDQTHSEVSEYRVITEKEGLTLLEEKETGRLSFARTYSLCSSDADIFSAETYLRLRVNEMDNAFEGKASDNRRENSHLLKVHSYSISENKRSVRVQYEAFAQTLNKEFIDHLKLNCRWRERELVNTMRSALSGLQALHDAGLTHGDLRMNSIVLAESNQVKIADQFAINFSSVTSAPSFLRKDTQLLIATSALLPPEAMKKVEKWQEGQNKQPAALQSPLVSSLTTSPEADLWALGVILLELMLLENIHVHFTNSSLKKSLLAKKIAKAKSLYKKKKNRLPNLLEVLLAIDPKTRLNAYSFIEETQYDANMLKSVTFQEEEKEKEDLSGTSSGNCTCSHGQEESSSGSRIISFSESDNTISSNNNQSISVQSAQAASYSEQHISNENKTSSSFKNDSTYSLIKNSIDNSGLQDSPEIIKTNEDEQKDTSVKVESITVVQAVDVAAIVMEEQQSSQHLHSGLEGLLFMNDDLSSIASTSMPVPHGFDQSCGQDSTCLEKIHLNLNMELNECNSNSRQVGIDNLEIGLSKESNACSSFEIIAIPPLEQNERQISEVQRNLIEFEVMKSVEKSTTSSRKRASGKKALDQQLNLLNQKSDLSSNILSSSLSSNNLSTKQNQQLLSNAHILDGTKKQFKIPQVILKSPNSSNQNQQNGVYLLGPQNHLWENHSIHQSGEQTCLQANRRKEEEVEGEYSPLNKSNDIHEMELKMQRLEEMCNQALRRSARTRELVTKIACNNNNNSSSSSYKSSSSSQSNSKQSRIFEINNLINKESESKQSAKCERNERNNLLLGSMEKVPFSEMSETQSRVLCEGEIPIEESEYNYGQTYNYTDNNHNINNNNSHVDDSRSESDKQQQQQHSMNLLEQLRLLNEQMKSQQSSCFGSPLSSPSSSSSYSARSTLTGQRRVLLDQMKRLQKYPIRMSSQRNSKEENLRLSAHYGNLALTHLSEYIAQIGTSKKQGCERDDSEIRMDPRFQNSYRYGMNDITTSAKDTSYGGSSCKSNASNQVLMSRNSNWNRDAFDERSSVLGVPADESNCSNRYSEKLLQSLFNCDEASTTSNYVTTMSSNNSNSNSCCLSHGFRTIVANESFNASCSDSITSLVGDKNTHIHMMPREINNPYFTEQQAYMQQQHRFVKGYNYNNMGLSQNANRLVIPGMLLENDNINCK